MRLAPLCLMELPKKQNQEVYDGEGSVLNLINGTFEMDRHGLGGAYWGEDN